MHPIGQLVGGNAGTQLGILGMIIEVFFVELFQEVLRHNRKNKHGFNHVEAGTVHGTALTLIATTAPTLAV